MYNSIFKDDRDRREKREMDSRYLRLDPIENSIIIIFIFLQRVNDEDIILVQNFMIYSICQSLY